MSCGTFRPAAAYRPRRTDRAAAPRGDLYDSHEDGPGVGEYPDSGKVTTGARVAGDDFGFARMNRLETDLDYWDGEP